MSDYATEFQMKMLKNPAITDENHDLSYVIKERKQEKGHDFSKQEERNDTTTKNEIHDANPTYTTPGNQIFQLQEFLNFLNFSCQIHDIISQNSQFTTRHPLQQQQQHQNHQQQATAAVPAVFTQQYKINHQQQLRPITPAVGTPAVGSMVHGKLATINVRGSRHFSTNPNSGNASVSGLSVSKGISKTATIGAAASLGTAPISNSGGAGAASIATHRTVSGSKCNAAAMVASGAATSLSTTAEAMKHCSTMAAAISSGDPSPTVEAGCIKGHQSYSNNKSLSNATLNSIDLNKYRQNRLIDDLCAGQRNARSIAESYINLAGSGMYLCTNDCVAGSQSANKCQVQSRVVRAPVNANKSQDFAEAGSATTTETGATALISGNIGQDCYHLQHHLNKQLDYVIQEGVMDSVLPFICPVPLPNNYNQRLKQKLREPLSFNRSMTAPLSGMSNGNCSNHTTNDSKGDQNTGSTRHAATSAKPNKRNCSSNSSSGSTSSGSSSSSSSTRGGSFYAGNKGNNVGAESSNTLLTGRQESNTTLTNSSQLTPSPSMAMNNVTASTVNFLNSSKTLKSTMLEQSDVKQPTVSAISSTKKTDDRTMTTFKKPKNRNDIQIHVCDEVKRTTCDFFCPQELLIRKMGYFATLASNQKLEDMDISVHCDIQVFDWLMKWIKYEEPTKNKDTNNNGNNCSVRRQKCAHHKPMLNYGNAVPIMVSANFLQMEPLLEDALKFCHGHLMEVLHSQNSTASINDALVTRLAAMFTNIELESIDNNSNRLTSRIWTKLIQSLFEPEPEVLRGHYYTLAGLFRCVNCNKYLTHTMKTHVSCIPGSMSLNRWGQLIHNHSRDLTWDPNTLVNQLYRQLKSWRLVYWQLWGYAHYLYCGLCETYFPAFQMGWCRYHPENAHYMGPAAEGRLAGPTGRYPCCGQLVYRFEPLPHISGCHYREHSVLVETDRDRAILNIAQLAIEKYSLGDMPTTEDQETIAKGERQFTWRDLVLLPPWKREGILPTFRINERTYYASYLPNRKNLESSTETESSSISQSSNTTGRKRGKLPNNHVKICINSISTSIDASTEDSLTTDENENLTSASDIKSKDKGSLRSTAVGVSSIYNPERHCGNSFPNMNNNTNITTKRKMPAESQGTSRGRFWSKECSARTNQDNQRNFEEKIMKQAMSMLHHKVGFEVPSDTHQVPPGGIYVRLEQEFKEQNRQRLAALNAQAVITHSGNGALGPTLSVLSVNARPSKLRNTVPLSSSAMGGAQPTSTSVFLPTVNGDIMK